MARKPLPLSSFVDFNKVKHLPLFQEMPTMARKPLIMSSIVDITYDEMSNAAQFVQVDYTNRDGSTFSDLLMVQGKKVHEAWDFSEGKAAEKPMSVAHPDFKFQGWDVKRFINETFQHPSHPEIVKIIVHIAGRKVTMNCKD